VFIEQVKNAVAAMLVIAVLNCMNYSGISLIIKC